MRNLWTQWPYRFLAVASVCLTCSYVAAQENKTVIGPSNPDLYHGANALLAGDAEEGVRLTLRGLQYESSQKDRITAMSNLCAGYIMLKELDTALSYCDQVIEQNDRHWRAYSNRALAYIGLQRYEEADKDLQKAEALAANSRKVKTVRAMLLDATDPVEPEIVIDERRQAADEDRE
ncbi:MAG: tetratricopeptide repeat protein [Gammaproteobacteria bacterium]|nr:tetratricopeptide repeat protein [Gammaproteobacteria bacterium]MDH3372793.1 tetratricopeptide repeat protein [Gammaproteobacteria bacterium]MDH3408095.1 tetratricopeptide repeat protein [Gammaproteobacteria bacterium]MDH3552605.1 tetratricopeptide repeat protein [Gammaproteobacteria bacterium]